MVLGSGYAATWQVAPHHLHPAEAQLQLDGACDSGGSDGDRSSSRCAAADAPLATVPSTSESEEDQLRKLEEEILAAAAASGSSKTPAAARSAAAALLRRGRRDRQWQHRILAVAAFKTEGQRRRWLEEDILSVAASMCSEMGSYASGSYSLDEALPQQLRRLAQNASGGPGGARGGGGGTAGDEQDGRWSAPVCGRVRLFTDEDEDVMNKIVGQAQGAAS